MKKLAKKMAIKELESKDNPQVTKKPYASPKLTEYGNVQKLTQSGAGSGTELPHTLMMCL